MLHIDYISSSSTTLYSVTRFVGSLSAVYCTTLKATRTTRHFDQMPTMGVVWTVTITMFALMDAISTEYRIKNHLTAMLLMSIDVGHVPSSFNDAVALGCLFFLRCRRDHDILSYSCFATRCVDVVLVLNAANARAIYVIITCDERALSARR